MRIHKNKKLQVSQKYKLSFLEWNNQVLVSAFRKIDLNIIMSMLLDILLFYLSGFFLVLWLQRILNKMSSFNLPADVASLGYEQTQQLANEAKSFYYLIIFSFIAVLIAIIFLASIIKGIIWAKTTKTRITFQFISKFLGINLMWMGFWFFLFFLIIFIVDPAFVPIFMAIALILFIYTSNILYTIFTKNQKFSSIVQAIKISIMKIHLFILPYAIFFAILIIVANLDFLARLDFLSYSLIIKLFSLAGVEYQNITLSTILNPILAIIIRLTNPAILLLAAFGRYYFSTLVLSINKMKYKEIQKF